MSAAGLDSQGTIYQEANRRCHAAGAPRTRPASFTILL
jgi:hypothetical protein